MTIVQAAVLLGVLFVVSLVVICAMTREDGGGLQ